MDSRQQELVSDFCRLLKGVSDDASGVRDCLDFLHHIMRIKDTVPPVVEFVSILREEKPLLFHMLKNRVTKTSPIWMILQLRTDVDEARKRLNLS